LRDLKTNEAMDTMGYETGKIYRLQCSDGNYYFGSTVRTLASRLSSHKHASKNATTSNTYNHINAIGWDNVTITLVELFPCETKQQLLQREMLFISEHKNDILCLNTRNPIADNSPEAKQLHKDKCKEYYAEHRDELLQKRRDYQIENREKRTDYNTEYRKQHSEKLKDYNKQYAIDNRERRNRLARERRAAGHGIID
jgi:predicted GIY-YIG superfamily endonuclease